MKPVIFFVALLFCGVPSWAQSTPQKVSLFIQHPDSSVATLVTTALTNKLSSLKNLTVIKNDDTVPEYSYQIAVNLMTVDDAKQHRYAASILLLERAPCGGRKGTPRWVLLANNVGVIETDDLKGFADAVVDKLESLIERLPAAAR